MACIGISNVVTTSVYSEKTHLKKLMMIIMIMNQSQEMTVFSWVPEIDFRYETKARKVMVDFKFDALYRYFSIESLLKSGSKKVNRKWVEQCMPTLH